MAKFRSLFRVSGDIGDVSFYEKDGQKYMRQASTMSKDRILNDPAFKRTRENMQEFAGAVTAGKALREGLSPVLKRYADRGFGGRLTAAFKRMQRANTTDARGKRSVEVVAQRAKLVGMSLQKNASFGEVCSAPYSLTASVGRNSVTLDIPVFDIDTRMYPPKGTTHFKFTLVVAALSDHVYDVDEGKYLPVDPDLNGVSVESNTNALDLDTPLLSPIQLVASLPGNPTMPSTTGLVTCVGVEFFQYVNGVYCFLASDNAMKIVSIY